MMDHFGIGTALQGMLQTYENTARRTGRTTSLIESLRDGDRVVVENQAVKRHIVDLLQERGLKVDVIIVDPRKFSTLFQQPPSKGRTLFEHTWVYERYKFMLEETAADIDKWQRETSGYGTAHIETRRKFMSLSDERSAGWAAQPPSYPRCPLCKDEPGQCVDNWSGPSIEGPCPLRKG
jgi:hypothetical protein